MSQRFPPGTTCKAASFDGGELKIGVNSLLQSYVHLAEYLWCFDSPAMLRIYIMREGYHMAFKSWTRRKQGILDTSHNWKSETAVSRCECRVLTSRRTAAATLLPREALIS